NDRDRRGHPQELVYVCGGRRGEWPDRGDQDCAGGSGGHAGRVALGAPARGRGAGGGGGGLSACIGSAWAVAGPAGRGGCACRAEDDGSDTSGGTAAGEVG